MAKRCEHKMKIILIIVKVDREKNFSIEKVLEYQEEKQRLNCFSEKSMYVVPTEEDIAKENLYIFITIGKHFISSAGNFLHQS